MESLSRRSQNAASGDFPDDDDTMCCRNGASNSTRLEQLPIMSRRVSDDTGSLYSIMLPRSGEKQNEGDKVAIPLSSTRPATVSFGSVQVRLYSRTVGDHPDVSQGPPITLDWDYFEKRAVNIDIFEQEHALLRLQRQRRSIRKQPFHQSNDGFCVPRLSADIRWYLLEIEFQVLSEDIQSAIRQAAVVRYQRAESAQDPFWTQQSSNNDNKNDNGGRNNKRKQPRLSTRPHSFLCGKTHTNRTKRMSRAKLLLRFLRRYSSSSHL